MGKKVLLKIPGIFRTILAIDAGKYCNFRVKGGQKKVRGCFFVLRSLECPKAVNAMDSKKI